MEKKKICYYCYHKTYSQLDGKYYCSLSGILIDFNKCLCDDAFLYNQY